MSKEEQNTKLKNMPNIALIGSREWQNKQKVKDLVWNLKQKFGSELTIISGGQKNGAEKIVKKYAIEFGCKYKEYGPAFENYNLYSAMPEAYYGKIFHPTQMFHRNDLIARYSDCGIVLISKDATDSKANEHIIKRFKKLGKPVVILE